jgi:hypothetical protein
LAFEFVEEVLGCGSVDFADVGSGAVEVDGELVPAESVFFAEGEDEELAFGADLLGELPDVRADWDGGHQKGMSASRTDAASIP